MKVLAAAPVSEKLRQQIKLRAQQFEKLEGRKAKLAVVLVGNDPASEIYTRNKGKAAVDCGMDHETLKFGPDSAPSEVLRSVRALNEDAKVDGILIQRPLPPQFNEAEVLEWIAPSKDVDAFHPENAGKLQLGLKCFQPCTPAGVMEILKHYQIEVQGKIACVVGRSSIVGKPMAALLLQNNATVIQCHSRTQNLAAETKRADIVVAAAGKPLLLGPEHFKPGAVVIDVGIHRSKEGGLVGDVQFEKIKDRVAAATPVPGGVGPMTITLLLANTIQAAEWRET